jgi:hypothetical protein
LRRNRMIYFILGECKCWAKEILGHQKNDYKWKFWKNWFPDGFKKLLGGAFTSPNSGKALMVVTFLFLIILPMFLYLFLSELPLPQNEYQSFQILFFIFFIFHKFWNFGTLFLFFPSHFLGNILKALKSKRIRHFSLCTQFTLRKFKNYSFC